MVSFKAKEPFMFLVTSSSKCVKLHAVYVHDTENTRKLHVITCDETMYCNMKENNKHGVK